MKCKNYKRGLDGCKCIVSDDFEWSIDDQIEYYEKKLAELKAQKEKEKWVFTEDEKVILRNIPDGYNWLFRDDTNYLYISNREPCHKNNIWISEYRVYNLSVFKDLFQSISSEDTEPCEFRKYI